METNLFVYIISHITITGYKTKTTSAFKVHHKLSVVSSLNNACPYPEPALTHLSTHLLVVTATQLHVITVNFGITANLKRCCDETTTASPETSPSGEAL